jgi:hypothetical protein
MFHHPSIKIIGHSGIEYRVVFIGQNVNEIGLIGSHSSPHDRWNDLISNSRRSVDNNYLLTGQVLIKEIQE